MLNELDSTQSPSLKTGAIIKLSVESIFIANDGLMVRLRSPTKTGAIIQKFSLEIYLDSDGLKSRYRIGFHHFDLPFSFFRQIGKG